MPNNDNTPAPDREEIRRLLKRWESGDISFYDVVEEAEAIEDRVWHGLEVIEFEPSDPGAISTEVLSLLSMGFVEPLFVDDIPHLRACLDARPGEEVAALERLHMYFDSLDVGIRNALAQKVYAFGA